MKYYYREPLDTFQTGVHTGLSYEKVYTYNPYFIEWQILNRGYILILKNLRKSR